MSIGQTYYHRECLEELNKERAQKEYAAKKEKAHVSKRRCFGWAIAAGIVGLGVSLGIFLYNKEYVNPALGVLYSILISYGLFAMIYCILAGSFIGEVFVWCAGITIKFPGLIFSWDLDGIAWLIGMKILFAILGFMVGVAALAFGIALSASLGAICFPFVLMNKIHTDYEDALV